jgi:predicted DNA-binding transcriptional regulator AlpA
MAKKTTPLPKTGEVLQKPSTDGAINPDYFYRLVDARKFFGYGVTQLDLHIARGDVPAPVLLSEGGRACGWFGRTILEWQAKRKVKPGKANDDDRQSS